MNRGQAAEAAALVLTRELRRAGLSVQLDDSGANFSKQFKRADRCGAKQALVIGDDETTSGIVRIKALQHQEAEKAFPLGDISLIVAHLKAS